MMKKPPVPVIIVSILLLIVGVAGVFSHLKEYTQHKEKLYVIILVELLSILAIVCGVLLLRAVNAGRVLAIAWVLSHVLISAFNSIFEMIGHIFITIVISILLFLPKSSAFFRNSSRPNNLRGC